MLPHPLRSYLSAALGVMLLSLMLSLPCSSDAQVLYNGRASYYHDALHGRKMSNGDPYHRDSMTCAHLKLPFGTMLKVRNLNNGKEVVVKVTDRGPYAPRFILDLSRAAARELGIIGIGHAPVEISLYHPSKIPFLLEEDETEIPELDLQLRTLANYSEPLWLQADSAE